MADQNPIRLARPLVDEDELNELRAVLASGYLAQGPKVAEFERTVANYVGTKHAFATTSATTALHLALVVLDVGPGDEVLVPDFTFPATANVVVQQGAVPILVDVDPATFTIDLADMARKISPRTRAVMPVHAFGLAADMVPIMALARAHGLSVVEDAACAIGTTHGGRRVGGFGHANCFSFHPRKVITTGEGGMITTDDDGLAERIALLRSHGGVRRDGRFTFEAAGFNYRMSDLQAAVGVAQMRKLDGLIARKRQMAARLTELLDGVGGITLPREPSWGGHIFQSYVVLLDEGLDRDAVIGLMREQGVETTLGTYALHAQPFYAREYHYEPGDLPGSYRAFRQSLTLPLYPQLQEADLDRIAATLRRALDRVRRVGAPAVVGAVAR
jgi:dTDP-4-amino-4,6-dideoxygalactose transaminase